MNGIIQSSIKEEKKCNKNMCHFPIRSQINQVISTYQVKVHFRVDVSYFTEKKTREM